MTALVITKREGPVLRVVNNNPSARNALSPEYYAGLNDALKQAEADQGIAAVVLSGAEGYFCAGGNLQTLKTRAAMSMDERVKAINGLHDVIRNIHACSKPVIAAVEGGAAGAGASLALACDLVVAADDSYFAVSYIRVGLTPDGGATSYLSDIAPRQLVNEILMFGDKINAARLHQLGAVNWLVSAGSVELEAQKLGERLAAVGPEAIASVKRLVLATEGNDLASQLDLEAHEMATAQGGAEAAEGISAFLSKRKPGFSKFRK